MCILHMFITFQNILCIVSKPEGWNPLTEFTVCSLFEDGRIKKEWSKQKIVYIIIHYFNVVLIVVS